MTLYTLGFIFDPTMGRVVLIEKQRPMWQKGKLNGIGGKIEKDERSIMCIVRETREESGIETSESEWMHVAVLSGPDWHMDVFTTVQDATRAIPRTLTDEVVGWYEIAALPEAVLPNVSWLIHLAKDKLQNKKFHQCEVLYT